MYRKFIAPSLESAFTAIVSVHLSKKRQFRRQYHLKSIEHAVYITQLGVREKNHFTKHLKLSCHIRRRSIDWNPINRNFWFFFEIERTIFNHDTHCSTTLPYYMNHSLWDHRGGKPQTVRIFVLIHRVQYVWKIYTRRNTLQKISRYVLSHRVE